MPMKRGQQLEVSGGKESVGRSIAMVEMKLEYLRALGVDPAALESKLTEAKAAFGARNYALTRRRLDELLVFFSLAAEEINDIVERFLGGGEKERKPSPKSGKGPPTLGEIRETVEDAFRKALHSTNLRRMVEVIAMEKVHDALREEGVPSAWLEDAVKRAVSGIETKKKGRSRKG